MHRRSAIVQAVADALALLPVTQDTGRIYPWGLADLPALNLRAGDELAEPEVDRGGADWPEQTRRFEIHVEIWVTAESDIDRVADDLALEVEKQVNPLGLEGTALGVVDWFRYQGSGEPEREGELEGQVLARILTWDTRYRVDLTNPT